MFKLCLTVILLGLTQINCESLPAFIWGSKTPSYLPALNHLNGDEFVTLVKSQTDKETLTVVFVENNLSVEDFSQCKLKTETCFQNLRKIQDKTYLTAVEDPVRALQASHNENKQKSVTMSNEGDLSEKVDFSGDEQILFVFFDDVEGSEDFVKHDELMNKLYNSIASKRENVIAIYTARHPSFVYPQRLVRKARDTESVAKADDDDVKKPQHVIDTNPNFLIALSAMKVGADDIDVKSLALTVNSTDKTALGVGLKQGTHDLSLNIELSGGTWWIPMITYNGQRFFPSNQISAYSGKSYGCVDLHLTNTKMVIVIKDVQMQPRFDSEEPELKMFSDKWNDCTGFFSPAIWGAIFVVFILLSIMSCGITMMMDIKTMDRFDDPKGKTITINAQD